jgi:hypothetical protein
MTAMFIRDKSWWWYAVQESVQKTAEAVSLRRAQFHIATVFCANETESECNENHQEPRITSTLFRSSFSTYIQLEYALYPFHNELLVITVSIYRIDI